MKKGIEIETVFLKLLTQKSTALFRTKPCDLIPFLYKVNKYSCFY